MALDGWQVMSQLVSSISTLQYLNLLMRLSRSDNPLLLIEAIYMRPPYTAAHEALNHGYARFSSVRAAL